MSDCLACVHLNLPPDGGCDAYKRIPHDIVSSEVAHDRVRGDEDRPVAFEPRPLPGGNGQTATVVAHLSGRHDQRKHGRGRGGGRAGMGDIPVTEGWARKMRGGSAEAHLVKNPDGTYGFTPERQALHDAAINAALAGRTEVPNPTLQVLGGGPASGKSRIRRTQPQMNRPNTVQANFDDMKAALPEYGARIAAGDLSAAAFTHAESSYMMSRLQAASIENRMNVLVDSTGNGPPAGMRNKIGRARAAGYRVEGVYVTTDVDTAVARAESRVQGLGSGTSAGRYIPPAVIREVHGNVSASVADTYQDFDAFDLYDTSAGGAGNHVMTYRDGATTVHDQPAWDTFLAKGEGVEF